MGEVEQNLGVEFKQAVFILTNEYLQLFEREASAREIGLWVDTIPRRFPRFKMGRLLAAVRKLIKKWRGTSWSAEF